VGGATTADKTAAAKSVSTDVIRKANGRML
jgi:hypothetical protein